MHPSKKGGNIYRRKTESQNLDEKEGGGEAFWGGEKGGGVDVLRGGGERERRVFASEVSSTEWIPVSKTLCWYLGLKKSRGWGAVVGE